MHIQDVSLRWSAPEINHVPCGATVANKAPLFLRRGDGPLGCWQRGHCNGLTSIRNLVTLSDLRSQGVCNMTPPPRAHGESFGDT